MTPPNSAYDVQGKAIAVGQEKCVPNELCSRKRRYLHLRKSSTVSVFQGMSPP